MFARVTRLPASARAPGLAVACLALSHCSLFEQPRTKRAEPSFSVSISAETRGKPVAGAKVLKGKAMLGTTDASGKVLLKLKGTEGDTEELTVQCPAGLASPEKPILVGLRAMAAGSPTPNFDAECVPLAQEILVGLRTENGANLPIIYLDEVIGHINAAGVTHLKLKVAPKEQVTLTIDTSKNPALRPQNPTLTFVAKEKDEMILLEQKFDVLKKKVKHTRPSIPQPI